ncbi:PEPxxWA-CTERM sorting domain-containing protein [Novosphingobium sp.]|uniref:PEPxxWA-CTERM sorting domain-containing protein n=1 Tax=Novosphingobium sp. TaxID=1874826 RepID=UPI001D952140|nr:PEPxxWA-CTERM sorting domain-containing protein [Novosphingobium sp.]MBX9664394.1 PEPxxWA-CTERM sorting domain-containing protein [Novosphingobium sp.]
MFRKLLFVGCMLFSTASNAAVVVDQNNLAVPGFYAGAQVYSSVSGSPEAAQTFTAGISGLLSKVDLMIGGVADSAMTLMIRPVNAGVIDPNNANALASFSIASPKWGTPFYPISTFDVSSAGVIVAAGQQYALSLSSNTSIFAGWAGPDTTPYAGGSAWGRTSTTSAWGNPVGTSGDLLFATYVDDSPAVTAVPEPSVWVLMVIGFGLVGGAMRRRRFAETLPAAA